MSYFCSGSFSALCISSESCGSMSSGAWRFTSTSSSSCLGTAEVKQKILLNSYDTCMYTGQTVMSCMYCKKKKLNK